MITFFTTPKPFQGKFDVIQRNAIRSWKALPGEPQVLVFGDEPGAREATRDLGVEHVVDVEKNEHGTPLVDALFARAEKLARHDILVYSNCDMIYFDDFPAALQRIRRDRFLAVGRSWGQEIEAPVDTTDAATRARIRGLAPSGKYRSGMDYFAFTRGFWTQIPPLAIGRGVWDQWLIYGALQRGPVVDISAATTIVHQNHDWTAHPGGQAWIWQGPEIARNKELAGPIALTYTIQDASHRLGRSGVRPVIKRQRVGRWLYNVGERYPSLRPLTRTAHRVIHADSARGIAARVGRA